MAISFVSGTAGSQSGGQDVTLTLTSLRQGDLVMVFGGVLSGTADAGVSTGGYTDLGDIISGGLYTFNVSYKIMPATPDSTVVGIGTGVPGDGITYAYLAFRGVDRTNPIDSALVSATATSSNPDPPSITTATRNTAVVAMVGSRINDASTTPPSGYGNEQRINVNTTVDQTIAGAWKAVAAVGAENPGTWTTWASSAWVATTVALREFVDIDKFQHPPPFLFPQRRLVSAY